MPDSARADVERLIRKRTGATTEGERSRRVEQIVRYRQPAANNDATAYGRGPFLPPGFLAANTTDVTTPVTNRTLARYLGNAPADLNAVTIRVNVTTAGSTITWAEIGIATSLDFVMGSAVDLIPEGFTAVQSTFNSTGLKDTEVGVDISRGANVWALIGQQAGTLFVLRAGIGDGVTAGFVQFADATRPSTMLNPTTFSITTGSANSIWLAAQW
jgi:hypothetical protein